MGSDVDGEATGGDFGPQANSQSVFANDALFPEARNVVWPQIGELLVEIPGRKLNLQSVFSHDVLFPVSSKCRLGESLTAVLLRPNSPLRILELWQLGLHSFALT